MVGVFQARHINENSWKKPKPEENQGILEDMKLAEHRGDLMGEKRRDQGYEWRHL